MNSNTELLKSQYNVYSQEKYKNFDNGNTRKLNNQTITEADLKKHTIGKHSLSYKIDLFSNIFGLDLDVKGQFLSENLRSRELVALLEIIIINLGKEPSIAFKSRFKGGIHCYYKLEKKYPFNLIGDNLRRIFKDYRAIEILPTCNKPLRFPLDHRNGGMVIDRDLNPIKPSQDNYTFLREKTAEATTYNFNELFGIPSLVTSFVFDGKTKKKQINNATRLGRYYKYLNKIIPKQRQTNDYISEMAFNGVVNKIPSDVVINDTIKELNHHNITRDLDLTDKRIIQRVKSHYRRLLKKDLLHELKERKKESHQLDLIDKYEDRINKIFDEVFNAFMKVALNPNRNNIYRKQDFTKRRRSLRKFLRELLKWEDYIKSLTNYERQVLECHYKNFFFYTKKGYTPLPRNLMRNWYEYYYLIIPILTCHGHLRLEKGYFNPFEAKEYHSEIIGNCNYFSVLF